MEVQIPDKMLAWIIQARSTRGSNEEERKHNRCRENQEKLWVLTPQSMEKDLEGQVFYAVLV